MVLSHFPFAPRMPSLPPFAPYAYGYASLGERGDSPGRGDQSLLPTNRGDGMGDASRSYAPTALLLLLENWCASNSDSTVLVCSASALALTFYATCVHAASAFSFLDYSKMSIFWSRILCSSHCKDAMARASSSFRSCCLLAASI